MRSSVSHCNPLVEILHLNLLGARLLGRGCFLSLLVPLILAVSPATVQGQGSAEDFDIRGPRDQTLPSLGGVMPPSRQHAIDTLDQVSEGELVLSWSRLTGAPSRIFRRGHALTPASSATPRAIAASFLDSHLSLLNLSDQDIRELRFSRDFRTRANGVSHLTMQQQVNGIDVWGGSIKINIDAEGRILTVSGELMPDIHASINTGTPTITDHRAVLLAAASAGVDRTENSSSLGLVYFPLAPGESRLGKRVTFEDRGTSKIYDAIVDADDGTVLWWKTLTSNDHFPAHGDVYTSDSPIPQTPMGTGAGTVARIDMPFNGTGFFPHDDPHFDWWDGGARTTTTSNNVDAYADRDGDDAPDPGSRPVAAVGEDFFFPIDLSLDPLANQPAAVTNLFFWNNRIHDWLYRLGFDEAAGNFQTNNYGLGGLGGDPVMAEAQDNRDGAEPSLCNANFGTPADGSSPRMQMFQCNSAVPERDGDFDNVVIAHEYGHGVHSRLLATSGNQRGNEGWCDYIGLSIVAELGDPYGGGYGIADYLFNGNGSGIRSFPYSTDSSIYRRTYADINDASTSCQIRTCSDDPTEICTKDEDCSGNPPATCVAVGGCRFHEDCRPPNTTIDQSPCRSQVHRTGELWANALWISRFNLIGKYGFASGAETMNRLVIDGMKLSPNDPTFLDGRDAILTADLVNNGGVNQCLIWDGFARMGMGFSALTTGVLDLNPVEGFDVPTPCAPVSQVSTDTTFGNVCAGDTATRTLTVLNTGGGDLIVTSVARTSGSDAITVDPLPGTPVFLGGGAQADFLVRCDPDGPGDVSATITVASNDTAMPQRDIIFTCTGGAPDLQVAIADMGGFGEVCTGSYADLDLTLFNQGTCDLTIDDISVDNPRFVLPASVSFPLILGPDADFTLPIRFEPDSCGSTGIAGVLEIESDDTDTATALLGVPQAAPSRIFSDDLESGDTSAWGALPGIDAGDPVFVGLSGSAPCPDINSALANTGSFGAVCSSDHADLDLTLFNQGRCDLTISDIALLPDAGSFQLPGTLTFPLVLSHDADFTVPIRFAPDACFDLPESRSVQITSDDPDEAILDIDISGTSPCGNLVIDQGGLGDLFSFPATVVDTTGSLGCFSDRDVILRNSGGCPLTIDDISAAGADFMVTQPSVFPVLLPPGEETLAVTVRFTPQTDADPFAPSEVTGTLTVVSDDPDGAAETGLCGESVAQSGVRILVTDVTTGTPVPVGEVDSITIKSFGVSTPGPINLRFTDQPMSSASVCGSDILYHVEQENLPETSTTGSNPNGSYDSKAKEGNLQTTDSFGLGQCEFRDFQLQLQSN